MGFSTWVSSYEMACHVWEAFYWSKLDDVVPPPPNPLSVDFPQLCSNFIKEDAEEEAQKREIPEIVQAAFYATTGAHDEELGVLPGIAVDVSEEALQDLKWYSF